MEGKNGQGRTVVRFSPPGYRFSPTDEELIIEYLRKKVYNQPLPLINYIQDVEVYKFSPIHLYDIYKTEREVEMYFFTSTQRKYASGDYHQNRTAGGGYWKLTSTKTPIGDGHNPIGHKKSLVYYKGGDFKQFTKTNWVMYEYTLPEKKAAAAAYSSSSRAQKNMQLEGWMLCKIYNWKTRRYGKRREIVGSTSSSSAPLQITPPVLQTNDGHQPQVPPCNVDNSSPVSVQRQRNDENQPQLPPYNVFMMAAEDNLPMV